MTTTGVHKPGAQRRHFTPAGAHRETVTITNAAGCYFWDSTGNGTWTRWGAALRQHRIRSMATDRSRRQRTAWATSGLFRTTGRVSRPRCRTARTSVRRLARFHAGEVFVQSGSGSGRGGHEVCMQYHRIRGGERNLFRRRTGAYHRDHPWGRRLTSSTVFRAPFEPLPNQIRRATATRPVSVVRCDSSLQPVVRRRHRTGDHRSRPRQGRRSRHRTHAEFRWLAGAAAGYAAHVRDIGNRQPVRRCARRDDLRLRARRRMVRIHPLRVPARHHHHGQGPDVVLRADGRDDRIRRGGRAVLRRGLHGHSCTARPSAAIRSPRRSLWPTSTSSKATTYSAACARSRSSCGPPATSSPRGIR